MVIKITTFSMPWPSKIYPNWTFLIENKPSGNPDSGGANEKQFLKSASDRFEAVILFFSSETFQMGRRLKQPYKRLRYLHTCLGLD
jgi:hypothetical protein